MCVRHRIVLAAKALLPWIGILVATFILSTLPAQGEVIISGTGRTLVSGTGGPGSVYHAVAAQARLAISGSTLSLVVANTSANDTTDPADALSSFYFDISHGGLRPTLTYQSASGPLYRLLKGEPDTAYHYTPPTKAGESGTFLSGTGTFDLRALKAGDETWQFKSMNSAATPFLGFGIGTVGNSGFPGNGFDTEVVGKGNSMINFSIYHGGDIQPTGNLKEAYLLKNSGTFTFTFTGTNHWSEDDIGRKAVFGFGTNPEGTIFVVPEPSAATLALLAAAAIACRSVCRSARRHKRHARHDPEAEDAIDRPPPDFGRPKPTTGGRFWGV